MTTNDDDSVNSRRSEAFDVLVSAVETLTKVGRPPTASEVRLEMGSLTYGGFKLKELGYKRFRDFLQDAEVHSRIRIDPTRAGDIAVVPFNFFENKSEKLAAIRTDLWKAFTEWNSDLDRWYSLKNDRAFILPREEAKLEPRGFRELRSDLQDDPDNYISIQPVPVKTQIEWMKQFASSRYDPVLRELFTSVLGAEKAVKAFTATLKSFPAEQRSWQEEFSSKVRVEVEKWRDANPSLSDLTIDRTTTVEQLSSAKPTPKSDQRQSVVHHGGAVYISSSRHINPQWWGQKDFANKDRPSESALRLRLHAAIDRMPIEELKALRIPIGYLFEE